MGNIPKREIIINKFDRMNGRPKFWWGDIPLSPPPGSATAHTMKIIYK